MIIDKYFWDLNEKALNETEKIIKNPQHPKFIIRIVTLLSRCDKTKEIFSIVPKKEFVETWPKIIAYWKKLERESDFRDWWETIYEQLLEDFQHKQKKPKGRAYSYFLKIGRLIKETRLKKGWSQKQLAANLYMQQPDISRIEEGKKNITLETLIRFCKVLGIKRIDIEI